MQYVGKLKGKTEFRASKEAGIHYFPSDSMSLFINIVISDSSYKLMISL